MKAVGIERSAIPVWLGGSHELETVKVLIDQVVSEGGPVGRLMETPLPEKLVERMTKLRKMNSGESPSPRASATPKFFSEEIERSTISDTPSQHTRSMEKETLNSSKKKEIVLRIACAIAVLLLLLFLFWVDLFFVAKLEDAMNNAARAGREEGGGRSSTSSIGNNGSADIALDSNYEYLHENADANI